MLRFILRKMFSKKWMFLALLIGNILLTGIACSNPLYADAVMQRMLTDQLDDYLAAKNVYPGTVSIVYSGSAKRNVTLYDIEETALSIPEVFGVDAIHEIRHYFVGLTANDPVVEREDAKNSSMMLGAMADLEAHAKITAGRMYAGERRADGTVEVIVSQRGLIDLNLLMGERRVFPKLTDRNGNPLVIEVVGVFDIADPSDTYWVRTPTSFKSECLMDMNVFKECVMFEDTSAPVSAAWYALLNTEHMLARNADKMTEAVRHFDEIDKANTFISINYNFESILAEHLQTARKVRVTLWVLQAPIYVLLAAFVFMVSRQILETEESEIAVLKSRGVRKGQIVGMYSMQSLLLALISVLAGLPLGSFITQVLGSANAFLEFVSRRALPVAFTREACLYAVAAALVSVAAMVLPVRKYARLTIVAQKQKKHRRKRPLWQAAFLDFAALGVAVYGLYSFNGQKELIAQRILSGEAPDPLLFLCSSLFIIGAGLVAIRLIPLLIGLIFRIFRRVWSPAIYASFLKVLRQRANQDFIMIFLVMTIALGVFNAQTASTINENADANTRYMTGADIVLRDKWSSNADQVEENPLLDLIYYEPDFGVYETMPGAASVAKVYSASGVSVSVPGGTLKNASLMAFDTDDFGRTAWFDPTLLPHHINEYLNAMAQNARAVILSSNFRDDYGFRIGDVISYTAKKNQTARGIVYGFVDYWPGYAPFSYQKGPDGVFREAENYLIAANLSQAQDVLGVLPYDVWIRAKDGADFIYQYAEETGTLFSVFKDVDSLLVEKKNDPMLKSLNGVLTVGFIVVLALCFIGFLMYWILSIRQRTLQFGIYRAMGMSMREIFTMLINEQLCVSVFSIAVGAVVGQLASRLYMPLIQIAYASSDNALPLRSALNARNTAELLLIVGAMLIVCMIVLGVIIRRMKIAQALKLGED